MATHNATPWAASRDEEIRTLRDLLKQLQDYVVTQEPIVARMGYIEHHLTDPMLHRRMMILDRMTPHIHGRVLEWGCHHALDSSIYRMRLGDSIDLYGCDIIPAGAYKPFHDFSGIQYYELDHDWRLNYEDNFFDTVTSDGVLEHVPNEEGSLGEVFRILKPGGTFAITCLPNKYSYTEALQRKRGYASHERLYSVAGTKRMLKSAGFEVVSTRYFLMVPTALYGVSGRLRNAYQKADKLVWGLNGALEKTWPINRLASNLMIVARKPTTGP